jgi:DNA-binding response OmpR family regulator
MTGDGAAETRNRALSAGATGFLTKPFEGSDFVLRIRNLLMQRFTQRQLQEAAARSEVQFAEMRLELIRGLTLAAEFRDSPERTVARRTQPGSKVSPAIDSVPLSSRRSNESSRLSRK